MFKLSLVFLVTLMFVSGAGFCASAVGAPPTMATWISACAVAIAVFTEVICLDACNDAKSKWGRTIGKIFFPAASPAVIVAFVSVAAAAFLKANTVVPLSGMSSNVIGPVNGIAIAALTAVLGSALALSTTVGTAEELKINRYWAATSAIMLIVGTGLAIQCGSWNISLYAGMALVTLAAVSWLKPMWFAAKPNPAMEVNYYLS